MEYSEDKKLKIDLSKESYEPVALLEHPDVRSIRIDDVTEAIVLPEQLAQFADLKTLYFSGGDRSQLYDPPANLEILSGVKRLTLWSFVDLTKLPVLPHIEAFDVVVRDPDQDVKEIRRALPNLKKLEIWGSHLKQGSLPPEIGDFARLEYLELVSCGLTDLPFELSRLSTLRSLLLRGLPMKKFPDVICSLENLEHLEFHQQVLDLPPAFANLKALRRLNFHGAFNESTMSPVDRWSDEKIYLRPIPEVIGHLPALEDLNMSWCGVTDLDFLKDSVSLKRFICQYSGLRNCDDFARFKNLETLEIENSDGLENIDGLASLPLVELSIEGCSEIEDISVILTLPSLRKLNIKGCDSLTTLDPLYQHPALDEVEASEDVKESWKRRELYRNMPPLASVMDALRDGDRTVFAQAVEHLRLHVEKNYHDNRNPLASFFGTEADDCEIVHLPLLEEAFSRYSEDAGIETLLSLVEISLRNVTDDNYQITIDAIEEIIKRKDVEAQRRVIEIFKKACEYYDFGHRAWEDTVLDRLYDDLFMRFETAALICLLENGHDDMMNQRQGDGADRCFAPAFKRLRSPEQFEKLMSIFFDYQKENIGYYGAGYFEALESDIRDGLGAAEKESFNETVVAKRKELDLFRLLESDELSDKIALVERLKDLDAEFVDQHGYAILRPMYELDDVPEKAWRQALDFFIAKEKCVSDVAATIERRLLLGKQGAIPVIEYMQSRLPGKKDFVVSVLRSLINDLHYKHRSMDDIAPLRSFLSSLSGKSESSLYVDEFLSVFQRFNNAISCGPEVDPLLESLERLSSSVAGPLQMKNTNFEFIFQMMARSLPDDEWSPAVRLSRIMIPLMAEVDRAQVMHIAVIASVKTGDRALLSWIEGQMAGDPNRLLSYNLACAYAHFSEKPAMLHFVQRSLELGKTSEQFLDDDDFRSYRDDADFLELLNPVD